MNARDYEDAKRALNRIIGGGEIVRREQVIEMNGRAVKVMALPPVTEKQMGIRRREPGPDAAALSGLINARPPK